MKFTKEDAREALHALNVDLNKYKFTITDVKNGMNVELEHGKVRNLTNVTNNDMIMTAKIALAHLFEDSEYYVKLKKMEGQFSNSTKSNYENVTEDTRKRVSSGGESEIQQVHALGRLHQNPTAKLEDSVEIQSVLFSKKYYTKDKAMNFLKRHNLEPIKDVHETDEYLRYRQNEPNPKKQYYTIKIKKGIKFVMMR